MKKTLLSVLTLGLLAVSSMFGADYGLPSDIQKGNILHCFNWPINTVKANLQAIAEAGFGAVQLSPMQRPDSKASEKWSTVYSPYDIAFKENSHFGTRADLQSLCAEAEKYGIKVIVDVVANHIDRTNGYHDTWWDNSARYHSQGNPNINYGSRQSITQDRMVGGFDVNTENSEVIARVKSYIQDLASMGVKGIRWDGAKHIALPSESWGGPFWAEVTSVPGIYSYGEILDNPGPDASIIKEYAKYMSFTDNGYSNYPARSNGGLPTGYGGSWAVNYGFGDKCVYWGESHDTYSNDEWSQNVDQSVIDRAYASMACRNDAAALYFVRPSVKGSDNIKLGSTPTTAWQGKAIAEVNKFRNKMVGKADYFTSNNNVISVTRKNGGAVIVAKGSNTNVTVENGGQYCPAGEYIDQVSGNKFTVTSSVITGTVGSTGIAVLVTDGSDNGGDDDDDDPVIPVQGKLYILGDIEGYTWSTSNSPAFTEENGIFVARNIKLTPASGESQCFFNFSDALGATWNDLNASANRYGAAEEKDAAVMAPQTNTITPYPVNVSAMGCKSWALPAGNYDFVVDLMSLKLTVYPGGTYTSGDNNPGAANGKLWVIGNSSVTGAWSPNFGFQMTTNGDYYEANGITLEPASATDTNAYFSFTDYISTMSGDAGWSDLNNGTHTRYGSATNNDAVLTVGTPYKMGNNKGDIKALKITAGTYDIKVNAKDWTVTVAMPSGINDVFGDNNMFTVSASAGNIHIDGLNGEYVMVAGLDGRTYYSATATGSLDINVNRGIFVVNVAGKGYKIFVR